MLGAVVNAFRIGDLRKKLLYTAALLLVYRVGSFIPAPGVDISRVTEQIGQGGIFGLLDMFAGGALSRFTVFALNVGPYITASIIIQLLAVVIPKLEELQKEGPEGHKKIAQYTRYSTVVLALIQAYGYTFLMRGAVENPGWFSTLFIVITLTAGSMFLMWLGEKISEHGIGNGISLLIFAGIVARIPAAIERNLRLIIAGEVNILQVLLFLVVGLAVIVGVVAIQESQRRIPVQYPKRVVGRRVYGGQSTHIPLRVNQAGVIPVIFASSVLAFLITLVDFFPALGVVLGWLKYRSVAYIIIYAVLVVFFTYFYTAITFNPVEVANNMKKYGGFIPGFRPGKTTADYLDRVLTRITLIGALFLAGIAVLPYLVSAIVPALDVSFGGTALLIVVGVALDTMKQIESHLLMRQYEGFLK